MIYIGNLIGRRIARCGSGWSGSTLFVSSGLIWYRKLERNGRYSIDYSSDGGVTWELDLVVLELDEDSIIMTIDSGVTGYRQEVRGTMLMIDRVITPTGFAGTEDIDWENYTSVGNG